MERCKQQTVYDILKEYRFRLTSELMITLVNSKEYVNLCVEIEYVGSLIDKIYKDSGGMVVDNNIGVKNVFCSSRLDD